MAVYPDIDGLAALAEELQARHGDAILDTKLARGELSLRITLSHLLPLVEALRTAPDCRFNMLVDITAIDHPDRIARFDIVWQFLSMYTNQRIRLKCEIREDEMVPSLTSIHPCANWFEREVFDMFGVLFSGHPDLRRILTDYGFRGHPLRKDFPTTGYVEVRYDETEKRVIYEPVKLTQEYRQFDFLSPWEGVIDVLPGDEKQTAARED
ncbi:NADH-quinone oxidoreductase subunit C [Paracoccus suum]|uniref:NADH-quinone oxidoreductase subunit C n=1 Tax=Paracoccus suum TaxID=2259340 RepID=A0A344PNE1_9RHOB|nr:NADH-quinone oxidoreductase subunit C [Paracoccus suum]AXC50896.1 NADH-quinone oxidoreductase subunit C [Paracoccus suum]